MTSQAWLARYLADKDAANPQGALFDRSVDPGSTESLATNAGALLLTRTVARDASTQLTFLPEVNVASQQSPQRRPNTVSGRRAEAGRRLDEDPLVR